MRQTTSRASADILATGFGTVVAMWAVGYVCRLPPAVVPNWLMAVGMLACVPVGGFLAGRYAGRGWRGGLYVGLISSLVNMMILGSLLAGDRPNQLVPSALWWIPGAVLANVLLAGLGALAGGRRPAARSRAINWSAAYAGVVATATLLLLVAGGVVTSADAGLAVVDWPNSFGYNMFLYPLGRMTSGIYYEHAHRLFGSLVGLTVLVLAVHLQRTESRRWLRRLVWLTLLLVVCQGILGGLRVTGRFTLSTLPQDTAPSIRLAIVHGVLGQVIFGIIVAMTVFLSSAWRKAPPGNRVPGAATDRFLGVALVALMVVQLALGAILRHVAQGLLIHVSAAVVVILLAYACAIRACLRDSSPPLPRLGRAMVGLTSLQVALGLAALIAVGVYWDAPQRPATEVVLATGHQAIGAILLACAVMLMVWNCRASRT